METIDNFTPQAVIVDAGKFPTNPRALRMLDGCERIVCCDGAANRFLETGHRPWRIVGDGDSLSPEIAREFAGIVRRDPDQETNDQTKAVRYLVGKNLNRLAILGATGLREDHTLGNLSLLVEYLRAGITVRAYTDFGVFIPICGSTRFGCLPRTQVSIFNFGATGLHAEGLRYPLRDFTDWWQGTLNESTTDCFTIHADGNCLIFLTYEPKQ